MAPVRQALARIAMLGAVPLLFGAAPVVAQNPDWLVANPDSHSVTLRLDVSRPPGAASAEINGHREGAVQIVVPVGWTVRWEWLNSDTTETHSLVVMQEREKLPAEGGRPAFDNAMTRALAKGLPAGQRDVTTFTADQAGWYWLLCGVPGHALAGEWIGLKVDPEARAAGVVVR